MPTHINTLIHIMIVDTNILWFKEKGPAVNPEFDTHWDENTALSKIELVIPEVVRGEILFQQTTSATKAFDKAQEQMEVVTSITTNNYKNNTNKNKLQKQITNKFDLWLKTKKGTIEKTPLNKIDWKDVQDSAVWRLDVFSPDEKNKDAEKGFRDRLIIETIVAFSKKEKRANIQICVISNDFLLRTVTEKKFTHDDRVSCYDSLESFSTYIKLTHEKLTSKFIKSIMMKAAHKFFTPGDSETLYYKESVLSKILSEFDEYINQPEKSEKGTIANTILGGPSISNSWQQSKTSSWLITSPEFDKLVGERDYHWITKIVRAITFKKDSPVLNSLMMPRKGLYESVDTQEKTLFLEFSIYWQANVRKNSTFHDMKYIKTEMTRNDFRIPTQEELEYFKISDSKI